MFFIHSLPRSGSAWLSVFLTGPDSFCYHEPFAKPDWRERMQRRPETIVGAVDTLAHRLGKVNGFREYALVRDIAEIKRSADRLCYGIDAMGALDQFTQATSGMPVIYYDRLHDIGYLADLWQEFIGTPFDKERAELLAQMNIQRDVRRLLASVA
jgi:hypothetical protein